MYMGQYTTLRICITYDIWSEQFSAMFSINKSSILLCILETDMSNCIGKDICVNGLQKARKKSCIITNRYTHLCDIHNREKKVSFLLYTYSNLEFSSNFYGTIMKFLKLLVCKVTTKDNFRNVVPNAFSPLSQPWKALQIIQLHRMFYKFYISRK